MSIIAGGRRQRADWTGIGGRAERLARGRLVGWLAGGLMTLGAALRVGRYLADWSLWVDEAMLAFNIVRLPPGALFDQPLTYFRQAGPVGFLLLEKLAVAAVGPSTFGLRLVPLVCALASLPLMWLVARRCLPTVAALAALAALGFFAVLEAPIYWGANAKQYAGDLMVTLLLVWLTLGKRQAGVLSEWFREVTRGRVARRGAAA